MCKGPRLVKWQLVFTKQAQKDAKKLSAAGLRPKAELLLDILRENPYQNPPPYEKLVGDLAGAISRRINIQHRLVYQVLRRTEGYQNHQNVDPLRMRERLTTQSTGQATTREVYGHYEVSPCVVACRLFWRSPGGASCSRGNRGAHFVRGDWPHTMAKE